MTVTLRSLGVALALTPLLAQAQTTDRPLVVGARLPGQKFSQIWRMNPDGTGRVMLTREARDATYPRWSPDGKWIVYRIGYGENGPRYVIDAEGKRKPRKVVDTPQFDWVFDLDEQLSPDRKRTLSGKTITELATDKDTTLAETTDDDATAWIDNKTLVSVRSKDATIDTTVLRLHDLSGKITTKLPLKVSKEDAERFDEEANYAIVWRLESVPIPGKILLARLGGGNQEGKWPVGLLVDIKTGQASFWGEFGYAGMFFSPDGKRFITGFNRVNPRTQKEEHILCLAETSAPQKYKEVLKVPELTIVGDWRGGKASR